MNSAHPSRRITSQRSSSVRRRSMQRRSARIASMAVSIAGATRDWLWATEATASCSRQDLAGFDQALEVAENPVPATPALQVELALHGLGHRRRACQIVNDGQPGEACGRLFDFVRDLREAFALALFREQPPVRVHQAPRRYGFEDFAVDDYFRQPHALHVRIRARLKLAAGAQLEVHRSLVAVFLIPFGTRDRFPDDLGRSLDIDLEHLSVHARLRAGRHFLSSRSVFSSTSAETNGSAYLRVQRS